MKYADVMRWLYRGQRPNWIAKILNRVAILFSRGKHSGALVTLEVVGRTSGRMLSQPMVVAVVDGQRYLVSMLGEQVQWVRNVQAAGGKAVLSKEAIHLEEVPVEQRAPLIKAYLQCAPNARPHIPVDKDAPIAEFVRIAAAYPVFKVIKE